MRAKHLTLRLAAQAAFFLLGGALSSLPALAQITTAAVHGTVTDSSGAVIPSAVVTAVNSSTGISTETKTDGHGYYLLPRLQIGGPYTITVTAPGFQNFSATGLDLHLNDDRDVDGKLAVSSATQSVQVSVAAVQVETSDTQLKQVVTAAQIQSLPLLGRDASGLQKLEPGSVESSDRFGTYSANGSQTTNNSFILDGIDINDGPLQSEGITVNPDALQEENIVTSTLNPEYSRNSGAIINQAINSGTNHIHGDAFEFYRDTFLNNGNYFSQTRPQFHQNTFGGTIGGPVVKDKLFLFLAYQGIRNRTGATTDSQVFSPAQLTGQFASDNNLVNGGTNASVGLSSNPIPFAINGCVAGTPWNQCFTNPGSIAINPSQWNPIASTLVQRYYPASNFQQGGSYFYNFNANDTGANDQGVIRVDYTPNANNTIWASSVFQSSPGTSELTFGASTLPGFGSVQAEHFKIFAADWTHTFNPTTLNELRVGYYRFNFAAVEPATPTLPSSIGFDITPQVPGSAGLPYIGITGYSSLGFSFEGPQPRLDTNINGSELFTKIIGNHSIKLGATFEQFLVSNPFFLYNNGDYGFSGGGQYSSGDPVIDFLMGIPDSYDQSNNGFIDARAWEYYGFAQDSWKITSDLTLNYGLAWDTETPMENEQFSGEGINCFVVGNQQSKIFPTAPPGLLFPGDPGCNKNGGPTTKYDHFGPRLGFAWSPSEGPSMLLGASGSHKLAVRGGFGLYYNRDQEEGSLQNLEAPPFVQVSIGASQFGGSPGFANPFADVAGNGSIPNPFPAARPTAGSNVDFTAFAPLDINSIDPAYSVPYEMNYNLNIQRSLPGAMVLQIGYVGSQGRKLVRISEADPITQAGHNDCLADPTCVAHRAQVHLLYPQYTAEPQTIPDSGGIPWYLSVGRQRTNGSSNYNSLQVSLQKAPTHGFSFTMSYTYSHSLDNASGYESSSGTRSTIYTPGYDYLNYGDSDYDARHRFITSYDYGIPLTAGMNRHAYLRESIGGWHVTGITTLQTGFPITFAESGSYNSLYCDAYSYYGCGDEPNTSNFHLKSLNPRNGSWFDTSSFSAEAIGTYGNAKRNFFHGPGYNYTNLEIFKNFPLGATKVRYIQLRLEAYNAFNHPNFAAPDSNYSDGTTFGQVTNVIQPSDNNGDPQPGRAIQLAGKFYF